MPKLSVLIPTYKYERYLSEAIESILSQDFHEFELIISDDASGDGSGKIIERYAARDTRVRGFVQPRNLGMVQNWNWCLEQARGEFVKLIFGDDKLASPTALGKMVRTLEVNGSAALVFSARQIIDEHSKVLRVRHDYSRPGVSPGKAVIVECLEQNQNLIGEPSVTLFRRTAGARGFDGRFRQIPDLEFWFHLLEGGDAVCLREPLCAFRVHSQQQTAANRKQVSHAAEQALLLREYYQHPWLREAATPRLLFSQLYALRKDRSPEARELRENFRTRLGLSLFVREWTRFRVLKLIRNGGRLWSKHLLRRDR
jgi:glycosyltransferase involved in cell wall biosynthesis